MTELWTRTATELAELFRTGAVSATEIVSAHLARIEEVNGSINAVVRTLEEDALATAAALDDARSDAAHPLGPLAGVPFTIKDNIDLGGDPTTQGVKALAEFVPEADAPIVERCRQAGAIPLARTNLPDLGYRVHTDSELHGLTSNPWNRGRTVAGSSGGEAAALATGMTPLGLGNDLGGSLRNPASCCSIVSLKPGLGRVPHILEGPLGAESMVEQLLAVEGPMARTVEDARLLLTVIAGADRRDPWSVPVPLEPAVPGPRRVAVMAEPGGGTTDPRIATVTRDAASALAAAGHTVEEVDMPGYVDVIDCWKDLVLGGIGAALGELEPLLGPDAMAVLRNFAVHGDSDRIDDAWVRRAHLLREWNAFFGDWDLLLTPTWTQLPFEHGFDLTASDDVLELMRPVVPANALGIPSAAVPAGLVDGLPVGVLVNGPAWSELLCLEAAETIEAAGLAPATPIDPVD